MKRFILATALMAGPAFAENINVFEVQKTGDGVVQLESNVTLQEAGILMGETPPPGTTGVVLNGKVIKWTDRSPEDVNEAFGGHGEPYIEDRRDPDPSRDEDPANERETEDDELIFTEDETASFSGDKITLVDGQWVGKVISQSFDDCPAGIADSIRTQTNALHNSPLQGQITPSFTGPDISPDMTWTTTGANSWIADLDQTQGGAGMRMQWAVKILSPTAIQNRQQINVVIPGGGNCQVMSEIHYVLDQ